jgi:hypothetical protein
MSIGSHAGARTTGRASFAIAISEMSDSKTSPAVESLHFRKEANLRSPLQSVFIWLRITNSDWSETPENKDVRSCDSANALGDALCRRRSCSSFPRQPTPRCTQYISRSHLSTSLYAQSPEGQARLRLVGSAPERAREDAEETAAPPPSLSAFARPFSTPPHTNAAVPM